MRKKPGPKGERRYKVAESTNTPDR